MYSHFSFGSRLSVLLRIFWSMYNKSCWLSMYESVIWSMVGPICLIATVSFFLAMALVRFTFIIFFSLSKTSFHFLPLLSMLRSYVCAPYNNKHTTIHAIQLNVFVFAMALRASIQIKEAVSDYGNMRTLLWLSIVLLPALGCQWILAMLAANETLEELHYAFYFVSFISALYIFIGYCVINRRVRYNIKIAWWRLNGKKVPSFVDDSLSQTRISCASRSVLTQNASPFDAMHNRHAFLYGISTSSTTSRSTTTKASSGTYMADIKVRRGRKRSNRRKNRGSHSDSEGSNSNPSLDLASSHSSDDDDTRCNVPVQNQINAAIQYNLETNIDPHHRIAGRDVPVSASDHVNLNVYHEGLYGTTNKKWSSLKMNIDNTNDGDATDATSHEIDSPQSPPSKTGDTPEPLYASARAYNRSNILALGMNLNSDSAASVEQIAEDDEDVVTDDDDEESSEPVMNIHTNPLEESDSAPDLNIHANPLNAPVLSTLSPTLGPQINQRIDSLPDGEHTIYTTWTVDPESRNRSSF